MGRRGAGLRCNVGPQSRRVERVAARTTVLRRPALNLGDQLDRPSADAIALRLPGSDVSWGELRGWVAGVTAELVRGGVGWSARVLLRVGDDLSRLVVSLGAQRLGAVVVPVNPATIGPELQFVASHSDPACVVADDGLLEDLRLEEEVGLFVNDAGRLRGIRRCGATFDQRAPGLEDPASILFTSGSSARPRAAVLSHHAHLTMGRDLALVLGVDERDSFLQLSPLFHVGGWATTVLPALATGCSMVMPGGFSASRFWADVERWQPTLWTTGLAFIEMVASRGGDPPAQVPFRHVLSNLRPDTWRVGRRQLRLPLGTYYGLTENDGRGTIALDIDDYEPGFVGHPYTHQDGVRIVRDGEELEVGEVGEIELQSESAMSGYFRDEEATARVLKPGPWIATGDLGHLDETGRLFFRGRDKNMIKRSGENVAAEEIELFLLEHPEVADVAAIAVPDRIREEEIKVLVVRTPGSSLAPEELHRFCAAQMAAFKVPRYVQFLDELPRTVSGKTDIGAIRRSLATPEGAWDQERSSAPWSRQSTGGA
jgi:crotonobetaine/carnitine-CoA ligase